jgi:hypothetical protein
VGDIIILYRNQDTGRDCDMMGFQAFTRLSVIVLPNGGLGRGKRNVSTVSFLAKELRSSGGILLCILDSRFDKLLTVLFCFKVSGEPGFQYFMQGM